MASFNRRAYSANRIKMSFDGTPEAIGAIQNANINVDFRLDAVSGIGSMTPYEWMPTMSTVTVDCDVAYLFGQELETLLATGLDGKAVPGDLNKTNTLVPQQSTSALKGIVFDISAIVMDDSSIVGTPGTGRGPLTTLWTATSCAMNTGSFRLAKHGMVIRNGSFNALDFHIGGVAAKGATA